MAIKGPTKVAPPGRRSPFAEHGPKPAQFGKTVAGPRIAPAPTQTRDYGKSPVSIPGVPFNGGEPQ